MQPIEDFMQEYFKAQADMYRAKVRAYVPFRDRFFAEGYEPFNPYEMVHACEAERITVIRRSDATAIVTTTTVYHTLQPQHRYHLQSRGHSWVIVKIEDFCMVCGGKGSWKHERECTRCKGTGWAVLAA